MGTTPTEVVNWADEALALKTEPDTARQEQGWIGSEASAYSSYVFQPPGLGNAFRFSMIGNPARYLQIIVADDAQGDQFVLDLQNKLVNGGSDADGANAYGYIQIIDTSFNWKFINKGSTHTIESSKTSGYISILVRLVTPEEFVEDYDIYRDVTLVDADTAWSQFISYDQNDLVVFNTNNPNGIVSISAGNVAEKPVLQIQNGLQNNQAQWTNFFLANMQEVTSDEEVFNYLWNWDTGGCFGETVTPFVFTITKAGITDGLSWVGLVAVPATASDWEGHLSDCLTGARYLEFMDMMNRGLAIQIIDGDSKVWTIHAPNGIGENEASMTGTARSGGNVDFTINTPTVGIVILSNGLVVPDFSQFTLLNSANFATFNPTGVGVGIWGTHRLLARGIDPNVSVSNKLIEGHNQRKKWIRPLNVSSKAADPTPDEVLFTLEMASGRRYSLKSSATYTASPNWALTFTKVGKTMPALYLDNLNSNRRTLELFGQFNVTADVGPYAVGLTYQGAFDNPQGDTTDLHDMYGYGNFYDNYVIIEEAE